MNNLVQEPPLPSSFQSIHVIQDLISKEPRIGLRPLRHSKSGKSLTQSLWLENNVLNDLKDFNNVVSQLLEHPENLAWIDLSFNNLTSTDPVLTTFFNLSVLYLHGNSIQPLGESDRLQYAGCQKVPYLEERHTTYYTKHKTLKIQDSTFFQQYA
ncbi:hypothetical protein HPG69_004425 [Diceros bicornis minor]|uniref:Leucine-rich repeat-containing protein 51 n=1 Tax=Diceros bicornis minor TaxID=77932 RepID=A0A7J7F920_DICBM|nr:hypothetical protein HPG69_004425 [Diceros bicornis minor]